MTQLPDWLADFGPTPDQEISVSTSLHQKCSLVINYGNIVHQHALGVIVPNNTAIGAPGGAAAAVMYVVDQVRKQYGDSDSTHHIYDVLFPSLHIQNPILLQPGDVVLDMEERPQVGKLGAVAISKSLNEVRLHLQQGWERIIFGLIRHQGGDVSDGSIRVATANSLEAAVRHKLQSVVMAPFGTGLFSIPVEKAASLMIPVIAGYCRGVNEQILKEVIIVMNDRQQFEEFKRTATHLLRE